MSNSNSAPRGPGRGRIPAGAGPKPKHMGKTLVRLFSYISGKKWLLVLVFLFAVASSVSGVMSTYMIRPILNDLTSNMPAAEKIGSLVRTLGLMLIIFLAGALCSYLQTAIMAQVAQRGVAKLRAELFEKLQKLPLSYFDAHSHGELMSRFSNDADSVQQCLEQSIVQMFSSCLTFISIVAVMIITSPLLFLVTLLMLAANLMVFVFRGKKSREYYRQQQAALGELNGNIQEMIEGMKVVKAFTHEQESMDVFRRLNEQYYTVARNANYYATSIMPLAGNISNIGYAVTAVVGGIFSFVYHLDIGGLAAFLQYCRQVTQPINQVSQQTTAILAALAGAERIFEVMDKEPEVDEGKVTLVNVEPSIPELRECPGRTGRWAWKCIDENGDPFLREVHGDVRLLDVSFSYVPEKPVLKHIDFYAKPGQKIAFVGSTGAGKTTVTNLFNRFYEIKDGTITYDGIDVRDIRKDDLRRSIAVVLQDTHLFTGTVMENIRYGRLNATDDDCVAAAKLANAHSFIRRLPDGYQTVVTGDGENLSQGQRQLLAIARAAVADPPVLVLDEATSSIDTRTEKQIEIGLDQLMRDRTVFVIAHRLSTVRNSNCIVVIEHGEILEKGTHDELLDLRGRYYKLYTGQSVMK